MPQPRTIVDLAEPDSVQAVQATLLDVLSRSFALREEEVTWAAYRISVLLGPFGSRTVLRVPVAALTPVRAAHHTRLNQATTVPALQVDTDAWADSLTQLVHAAYDLDGVNLAAVRAQIRTLLTDLGIGDPAQPRPARYVPRDVMLRREDRTL